jgi:predicted RNA-binding protein
MNNANSDEYDTTLTNIDVLKIKFLNFAKMRNAGLSDESSHAIAHLRSRWIALRCLYEDLEDRGVSYDEVVYIDEKDNEFGSVVSATTLEEITDTDAWKNHGDVMVRVGADKLYGAEFCTLWAENIWAISELVMRIRGHHYKAEYEDLITRVFKAASEGSVDLPANYKFADIFHTAIHPFGIKALPVMTAHFQIHGKIANSLLIRFSGAPNGTAVITTTSAGLNLFKSESWYSTFESTFKSQIDLTIAFARSVLNDKYSYHMSARLYGLNRLHTLTVGEKEYTLSEAENIVGTLAPMIKGFSDAIIDFQRNTQRSGFAFGKQQVLDKRASNNPLAAIKMSKLVEVILQVLDKSETPDQVVSTLTVKNSTESTAVVPKPT